MVYKELVINIDESKREQFVAELLMLNFESFTEDEEGLHAFMPANRWSDSIITEIKERLYRHQTIETYQSLNLDIRDVMPKNWQEQWERTIEPVWIGKNIVIRPSWQPVIMNDKTIDIIIDPRMSFGTGHHETTQMMVELIEEYCLPGMNVLDIGTGSGILAILAARMKAALVIGIDTDPDAISDAKENCLVNNVQAIVSMYTGKVDEVDLIKENRFDLILANIERKTILNFFPAMVSRLNEEGILILSGLLDEDYTYMEKEIYENELSILKLLKKTSGTSDTWLGIALKK